MQTITFLYRKHFGALLLSFLISMNMNLKAQNNLPYQTPPKAIANLIDAAPTPAARLSPSGEIMLLLDRPNLPSIEEVAQEELRLAGIRINPKTNGSSRSYHYYGMTIKPIKEKKEITVTGLPPNAKIENISWSPDGSKVAFTNTLTNGIELWLLDIASAKAKRLTDAIINDAMSGLPYKWFSDNNTIVFKSIPNSRGQKPSKSSAPKGPTIQENKGSVAPVRTYQDLLQNQYDEELFEYYTSSQLMLINVNTAEKTTFGKAGIINNLSVSPDGNYVFVATVHKPFSYIVPYNRFPFSADILDKKGIVVKQIADIPSAETIPKGFGAVRTGPRSFQWRTDHAATLVWVEAQDGGNPKKEADIRDKLFSLEAPFTGKTKDGTNFKLRFGGVDWGTDDMAIVYEWWWQSRQVITSKINPSNSAVAPVVLFDRSWEDKYNDPGNFETTRNKYGRDVLMTTDNNQSLYLRGQGASSEGNRPFVDKFDLASKKATRLWRSEAPYYEYPISILNEKEAIVLTRRESNDEPANYFLRDLDDGKLDQITTFPNPYTSLKDVKKELIKYKRADGIELTGTLYLPVGYDKEKDGRLPVLMWAYPREFKSKDAAGQVTDSPYEFIRIGWYSPLFWVTQGYAVFDDFGMPIIGEGDEEPNETFVKQLVDDAEAAINKLDQLGVADTDRLAVGGHSYGAFMTANLMAHSDLFAAGISRSGAYNRTLTPFGFQSEERTFWEASDTYFKMSPFMHADKIKEPLLLIHGEADNNSGTYPMQSERFYAALKGHGANVRLVMLPHESHGYRAKESVMHMLWEMTEWLDTHVKNKKVEKPVLEKMEKK